MSESFLRNIIEAKFFNCHIYDLFKNSWMILPRLFFLIEIPPMMIKNQALNSIPYWTEQIFRLKFNLHFTNPFTAQVQISGVTYLQILYLNWIRSFANPDTSSFVDIASIVTFNIQLNFLSNKIFGFFQEKIAFFKDSFGFYRIRICIFDNSRKIFFNFYDNSLKFTKLSFSKT